MTNATKNQGRRRVAPRPALTDSEFVEQHGMISRSGKVRTPRVAQQPEAEVPAPRPNAERRNETTHPDGAAAVAAVSCPACKARKGQKCLARSGERTNHVHAGRMGKWEAK